MARASHGCSSTRPKRSRRAGRTLIHLQTHDGTPAVAFYERLGYVAVGRLPGWAVAPDGRLVDNLFMVKDLTA